MWVLAPTAAALEYDDDRPKKLRRTMETGKEFEVVEENNKALLAQADGDDDDDEE
jgi:hypothetical protein